MKRCPFLHPSYTDVFITARGAEGYVLQYTLDMYMHSPNQDKSTWSRVRGHRLQWLKLDHTARNENITIPHGFDGTLCGNYRRAPCLFYVARKHACEVERALAMSLAEKRLESAKRCRPQPHTGELT
jgi:hypothetical protein